MVEIMKTLRKSVRLSRKYGCNRIIVVCLLTHAVSLIPKWVYGRKWLLELLAALMVGALFSAVRHQAQERQRGIFRA